ncbi:MAG TPA: RdgB/HAM1 family non-canonical purine NTP pyrophosphatase [Cyclobacteriaceae bacterium]|nr:RdgB/HAM1 family non-canonical purine NTP pyrophosphatase [Cyclobacteriaceae bacterium]
MKSLCFATNNENKIAEIRAQLGSFFLLKKLEDAGCLEELPETQDTIEGNSRQKATYVFDRYNVPCFADDTGLEVEALHGEPGVHSARYAGEQKNSEDNIQLLLARLNGSQNRKARFRTVITLAEADGISTFEGIVNGIILEEKRGTLGFGYDPVFQPNGFSKTFAEMSLTEKSKISHRAIAMNKLIQFLKEKYS